MLSGRVDKASIDSDTKPSMVCVWPEIVEDDMNTRKGTKKESKIKTNVDVIRKENEMKNRENGNEYKYLTCDYLYCIQQMNKM